MHGLTVELGRIQIMRQFNYLCVLRRIEQLRHVLHYKHGSTRALHDLHEGPPKLLARVGVAVLVQKAKTLTWWTADDDVCLRDMESLVFQEIHNIVG